MQYLLLAEDEDEESLAKFQQAAGKFRGKVLFVHVDEDQDDILTHFGVKVEEFPLTLLVDAPAGGSMKTYKPKSKTQSHRAFLRDYFAGKVKRHVKSEEVPASQDEAVYKLVGQEFNKVALDDTKDVLVEFYAPWCGKWILTYV